MCLSPFHATSLTVAAEEALPSGGAISPTVFLFLQIVLTILDPLPFHVSLRINLSISTEILLEPLGVFVFLSRPQTNNKVLCYNHS